MSMSKRVCGMYVQKSQNPSQLFQSGRSVILRWLNNPLIPLSVKSENKDDDDDDEEDRRRIRDQ